MTKFFNVLSPLAAVSLFVFVAGCSSDGEERPEYLDSYSLEGLEIPPQLTRPNVKDELQLPEPSAKAMELLNEREQAEGTIAPIFKGLALKSSQGMHWLEIEQDADELWPLLKRFLAYEGIKIERDEPLLGFLETEWLKEYEPEREKAFYERWIKTISPDFVDKFRIRLERQPGQKLTRVYVSHRGLEIALAEDGNSRWQQRDPQPMLEREILYRMVLYTGLEKARVDDMFGAYQSYQERLRSIAGSHSGYEIIGNKNLVWPRLIQALDRTGVEIARQDEGQGQIEVVVSDYSEDMLPEASKPKIVIDEYEYGKEQENPDEREVALAALETEDARQPVRVFLSIKAAGHSTQVYFTEQDGADIDSPLAVLFRDNVVNLLK